MTDKPEDPKGPLGPLGALGALEEAKRKARERAPVSAQDTLSEVEVAAVLKRLDELGISNATCELCGRSDWHLASEVFSPMALSGRGRRSPYFGGIVFPSVILLCLTCGNSKLLNIFRLGVRKPDPLEPDSDG